MLQTKIQLLPAEMELVSSPAIILTKNAILQKIKLFLEEIQLKQLDIVKDHSPGFPPEILKISPKISRGENYKGLPWFVLDYPRYFQRNTIFAIRTMFWWGNFFSITLHLSGSNKTIFSEKIISNIEILKENDFYVYEGKDEWEHDPEPNSFKKLSSMSRDEFKKIISANSFLKLAIKFPIEPFEAIEEKLVRSYKLLVKCCC
jgi:hypothetical protein